MKLALLIICAALAFDSGPDACPTVTVKGEGGGPLIINKTDYEADTSAWELWTDETPSAAPVAPVAPASPATPVQMVVTKIGRGDSARFYVTDMEKTKIAGIAGIDEAGYADEGSAWAAVQAALSGNG